MPITDRMTLRRTNWPDVDELVALSADAEVMGLHHEGQPMTAARVLSEEMPRLMAHNKRTDELGGWVARERDGGAFLGWFLVDPVDGGTETVALDYRLRRSAWNQGYELEGALCMIAIARAAGATSLVATTSVTHLDAHELLESVGLQLVESSAGAQGSAPVEYVLDLTNAPLPSH